VENGEDTTFQREEKRGDWRTEKNSFNLGDTGTDDGQSFEPFNFIKYCGEPHLQG
jgi:hypothetical protein